MKRNKILVICLGVTLVVAGFFLTVFINNKPGEFDNFAKCLEQKGAIFYGAFWCPHCQNQKNMFGNSEKLLPYVECSTPDGNTQLPVCRDKKVSGYPTWDFPDGSREVGEVPLQKLADKTGCSLPQ